MSAKETESTPPEKPAAQPASDDMARATDAKQATPESASAAASQAAQAARKNPVRTAAIGALVLGFLLGWLIARR